MSQAALSSSSDIDQINAGNWSEASRATKTQLISVAIGDHPYGVGIMAAPEIGCRTDTTHLPKQSDCAREELKPSGAIVPIVDLRCRFGQGLTETTPRHIMTTVQIDGRKIGLIGDRVLDIVSVETSDIQSVPRTAQGGTTDFLSGLVTLDKGMIALIDLTHLLSEQGDDKVDRALQ